MSLHIRIQSKCVLFYVSIYINKHCPCTKVIKSKFIKDCDIVDTLGLRGSSPWVELEGASRGCFPHPIHTPHTQFYIILATTTKNDGFKYILNFIHCILHGLKSIRLLVFETCIVLVL